MSLIPLLLAACSGRTTGGGLATRADSAGIEIATNSAPAWPEGGGWRIDPEPTLQIGHPADSDPHYDLLRVAAGRILANGDLVVAVEGHTELRIYDSTGEWRRSIGRDGEGPGEMRSPGSLVIAGDTIFLIDTRLSRVSAFAASGAFLAARAFPVANPGGRIPPTRRLADGRWLGSGLTSFSAGQVAPGIHRGPTTWYRLSADLSRVEDTVAVLAGTERLVVVPLGKDGQPIGMMVTTPPFGRATVATTGPDFLLAGDNGFAELRFYTPQGAVTRIIRWTPLALPVDAALLEQVKQEELSRSEGDAATRQGIEARFQVPPPTQVVPYFSGLHLDPAGNIWVRGYPVLATDSIRFDVFQPDGQLLGRLALPPSHTVLDIGADRILTVWRDADDLEYLRVYRLVR